MTVYVDLDGVLANFEGKAIELFGAKWRDELEKPNWGEFSKFTNLYEILEPMHDAKYLWQYITARYEDVQILTAIPKRAHFPNAVNDKRAWVYKHFGSNVRVNFGPYAQDKQYHCKPSDILIDDMLINCEQWNTNNGNAILHTSAEDSIKSLIRLHYS